MAMFRTSDKSELTRGEYDLKSKYPEDSNKKERDKIAKSRMIAHPNSVLGKIRDKIPRGKHYDVASIIVESYIKAINEVLKGHSVLKSSLGNIRTLITLSQQKEDFVSRNLTMALRFEISCLKRWKMTQQIRGKGRKPMRKVSSDFQLNCIRMSAPATKKQLACLQTLFIPSMHATCGHS